MILCGGFMNYPGLKMAFGLIMGLIMFLGTQQMVAGQDLENKLSQRVVAFDSESTTTVGHLVEFAQRFSIPMGIEWFVSPVEESVSPVHLRNTTALDILQFIINQQSNYSFEFNNGLVHVFAPSYINDSRNFLNLRIPEFQARKENLFEVSYKLKISISRLLHPNMGYGGGYGRPESDDGFDLPIITFSGNNLTARQILDNIVIKQGNALWIVRLLPSKMMADKPYFAQDYPDGDAKARNFHWQFIALAQTDQTQRDAPDVLDCQVTESNVEHSTTRFSFVISMSNARVPGGIVTIQNCDEKQTGQPTYLFAGTLKEALDAIVKANPKYHWQVDNGVINLLISHDEPALLNVRIDKLKVENAPNINVILDNLLELPEVKAAIVKLNFIPPDMKIILESALPPRKRYTVECENVTVREAMNAIARAHGRAVWEYKEQRCKGETVYTANFVVR